MDINALVDKPHSEVALDGSTGELQPLGCLHSGVTLLRLA
jgi:hypothetical protein